MAGLVMFLLSDNIFSLWHMCRMCCPSTPWELCVIRSVCCQRKQSYTTCQHSKPIKDVVTLIFNLYEVQKSALVTELKHSYNIIPALIQSTTTHNSKPCGTHNKKNHPIKSCAVFIQSSHNTSYLVEVDSNNVETKTKKKHG